MSLWGTSWGVAFLAAVGSLGLVGIDASAGHSLPAPYGTDTTTSTPPPTGTQIPPPPRVTLDPPVVDFGTVEIGETAQRSVTVTNHGDERVLIDQILVVDRPPYDQATNCGDELGPDGSSNASCEVEVEFTPTGSGDFTGSLTVTLVRLDSVTAELIGVGASSTTTSSTTTTTTPANETTTSQPDASTTTPPSREDEERERDACDQRARDATVSYTPALDMTVGETERVVAEASVEEGSSTTTSSGPPTTVEPMPLQCEVTAYLWGSEIDFVIDPDEPWPPRSFMDQSTITWKWDVVPTKSGEKTLTLTIQAHYRNTPGYSDNYDVAIQVDVQPENLWSRLTRWSGGVVDYPLIRGLPPLLLLIGTAAAVWRWLLKRPWPWVKKTEDEATEGADDAEGAEPGG